MSDPSIRWLSAQRKSLQVQIPAGRGEGERVHIPDGYLSPQTCAVFYAGMVPIWYRATKRVRAIVKSQNVPLIAVGAAFAFLVMMFNIPVPDGTTAHAVAAVAIAVVLGPWAAVIAVSIALAIQALFFGDGGVLALGANCFNKIGRASCRERVEIPVVAEALKKTKEKI